MATVRVIVELPPSMTVEEFARLAVPAIGQLAQRLGAEVERSRDLGTTTFYLNQRYRAPPQHRDNVIELRPRQQRPPRNIRPDLPPTAA